MPKTGCDISEAHLPKALTVAARHCPRGGGYGEVFFNTGTGEALYRTGDWYTEEDAEKGRRLLSAVPGVKKVTVESECGVPKSPGWVRVYPPEKVDEITTSGAVGGFGDAAVAPSGANSVIGLRRWNKAQVDRFHRELKRALGQSDESDGSDDMGLLEQLDALLERHGYPVVDPAGLNDNLDERAEGRPEVESFASASAAVEAIDEIIASVQHAVRAGVRHYRNRRARGRAARDIRALRSGRTRYYHVTKSGKGGAVSYKQARRFHRVKAKHIAGKYRALHGVREALGEARQLSVPEQHQKKIALKTLKLSDAGARIMGGMTKDQARSFLAKTCGWTPERIARAENGPDKPVKESVEEGIIGMGVAPAVATIMDDLNAASESYANLKNRTGLPQRKYRRRLAASKRSKAKGETAAKYLSRYRRKGVSESAEVNEIDRAALGQRLRKAHGQTVKTMAGLRRKAKRGNSAERKYGDQMSRKMRLERLIGRAEAVRESGVSLSEGPGVDPKKWFRRQADTLKRMAAKLKRAGLDVEYKDREVYVTGDEYDISIYYTGVGPASNGERFATLVMKVTTSGGNVEWYGGFSWASGSKNKPWAEGKKRFKELTGVELENKPANLTGGAAGSGGRVGHDPMFEGDQEHDMDISEISNGGRILGLQLAKRKGGQMYQLDARVADAVGAIDAVLPKDSRPKPTNEREDADAPSLDEERIINDKSVSAFFRGEPFRLDNTKIEGDTMYLHGNAIARKNKGVIEISAAGWPTRTTQARLNAILKAMGAPALKQKNGVWYMGDEKFSTEKDNWTPIKKRVGESRDPQVVMGETRRLLGEKNMGGWGDPSKEKRGVPAGPKPQRSKESGGPKPKLKGWVTTHESEAGEEVSEIDAGKHYKSITRKMDAGEYRDGKLIKAAAVKSRLKSRIEGKPPPVSSKKIWGKKHESDAISRAQEVIAETRALLGEGDPGGWHADAKKGGKFFQNADKFAANQRDGEDNLKRKAAGKWSKGTQGLKSMSAQESAKPDVIAAMEAIEESGEIGGVTVDRETADVVLAVYDALSEENRAILVGMPVARMIEVAKSLIGD